MALSALQLVERLNGVGGSECAAALGLSKWKTARQLYHEKRGEFPIETLDDEATWFGRMLEPVVRQKFAEKTGRVVRLPTDTLWHPEHDFMLAHVDGVSELLDGTDPRGYEGKTAWHSTGWGEEGTDEIPTDYLMQVHHYEIVTSLPVFDVMTLIGRKFAWYEIAADKELHGMIIEGERDFMRRVREGDPPPFDYEHKTALDVVKKLYPGTNGKRLVASADALEFRKALDEAAAQEKSAKALKESMKARLLEEMGEAALLAFPDGKALRRQTTKRAGYTVNPTEFIDSRFITDPRARATTIDLTDHTFRNTK